MCVLGNGVNLHVSGCDATINFKVYELEYMHDIALYIYKMGCVIIIRGWYFH